MKTIGKLKSGRHTFGAFVARGLAFVICGACFFHHENAAAGTRVRLPPMNVSRSLDTATLLPNGKVLHVGGLTYRPPLVSAELFDPATSTWSATGSMVTGHDAHTATLLPNGKVLVERLWFPAIVFTTCRPG